MFRSLWQALHAWLSRSPLKRPTWRLTLEVLEDCTVPAEFAWTGTSGDSWNTGADWTNLVTHTTGVVPGSGDYAYLGSSGSNTSVVVTASTSVDRTIMDSSYTATLTVNNGVTLSMTNYFTQYGTLTLNGTASVGAGGNVYINGTLTNVPTMSGGATLSSSASFYVESGATVSGSGTTTTGLTLSASSLDDDGTLNAGAGSGGGALTISGNYAQNSDGTINVYGGSTLVFQSGGNGAATADVKGTLNLGVSGTGGATIDNSMALDLDGGTLNNTGTGGNTITGDVRVYNAGYLEVGSSSAASTVSLSGGSLTVGASGPGLSATGGTLDLYSGSALNMPYASGSSTFLIAPATTPGTTSGVLNMNTATITMNTTRVAKLDMEGAMNVQGGDMITGNLSNAGTITFGGSTLMTLTVSSNYTQTSDGTLSMRLNNGTTSTDVLAVSGTATLDGTLDETALASLTPTQTWLPITYTSYSGNFATFNPPDDGNLNWGQNPGASAVKVTN